jgi:hypothetical protein
MNPSCVLKSRLVIISAALSLLMASGGPAVLAADAGKDQAALIKALPRARISMVDGLRQATKSPEVPISAKFEFDDQGKLSLSVYTAEKGLAVDAEHNVLKELSGDPEGGQVGAEDGGIQNIPACCAIVEHLALMSLSPSSLADIVSRAQKAHPGTVFSITPAVRSHKPVFVMRLPTKARCRNTSMGSWTERLSGSSNSRLAHRQGSPGSPTEHTPVKKRRHRCRRFLGR